MSFEQAREIADALLRTHGRRGIGVLAPRRWSELFGGEPWWMQTECLVEPTPHLRLDVRLRFLHLGHLRELDFGGIAVTDDMELELPVALPEESAPGLCGVLKIGATRVESTLERVRVRLDNTTPWHDGDATPERVLAACFVGTHLLVGVSDGEDVFPARPHMRLPEPRYQQETARL